MTSNLERSSTSEPNFGPNFTVNRHMRDMATGTAATQATILADDRDGSLFQHFAPVFVPGSFQTRDYATAMLTAAHGALSLPGDVDETVELRMQRAAVVPEGSRSYHVILAEAALYGAPAEPEVLIAQLQHLLAVAELPNVRMGVLPLNSRTRSHPMAHLDIVDGCRVTVETLAGTIRIVDEPEVGMLLRVFDELSACSVYGEGAMAVIGGAQDHLRLR